MLRHAKGSVHQGTSVATLSTNKLAAGIVAYHPDRARLLTLVETLRPDVGRVIVFCNSALPPDLREGLTRTGDVVLLDAPTNLGIGAALNGIIEAADASGFDAVILFDQDSIPPSGMTARLIEADAALIRAGERPAVVGPRMVAPDEADSKPPTYRVRPGSMKHGSLQAVVFMPTSGSLIRLAVLRSVGPFRADYFIDGVDLEWTFRAWSCGFSCWLADDCRMVHTVGAGVIAWPWLRFRMPAQRPFRMYCTVRNTLYGLRLRHIPIGWKMKQVAYLPIQVMAYGLHHRLDSSVLKLLAEGVRDGLRGRLGHPKGLAD